MKTALITGITGQDGSYLAELLLSKNYFCIEDMKHILQKNYDWNDECMSRVAMWVTRIKF